MSKILIDVKKWSVDLNTRSLGEKIRKELYDLILKSPKLTHVLNFDGIGIVSHSCADEIFGKLAVELGKDNFKKNVGFKNLPKRINTIITYVVKSRLIQSGELKAKPNEHIFINSYVEDFQKIYSQSRISNTGTRGYNEDLYVSTNLDDKLKPAIMSGEFQLIIITGNAGDGKTAYIERLEQELHPKSKKLDKRVNGSTFTYDNKIFTTNHDGSQDEGDLQNDGILFGFFEDYKGSAPPSQSIDKVAIIAINEGRLLDFLFKRKNKFKWLRQEVENQLIHYKEPESKVLVVNLNLRSVVNAEISETFKGNSLLDKILDSFLLEEVKESCDNCPARNWCYIKFNLDSFSCDNAIDKTNDVKVSQVIRNRLKLFFQITHFRRRLHITMRDLRSALSFIIFGIQTCEEIQRSSEEKLNIDGVYYNSIFNITEKDRLIKHLAELDIAYVSIPDLDNELNYSHPSEQNYYLKFTNRIGNDIEILEQLFLQRPESIFDKDPVKKENLLTYHQIIKRRYFFERQFIQFMGMEKIELDNAPDLLSLLPIQTLEQFIDIINGTAKAHTDIILQKIIQAISLGEKIYADQLLQTKLCVRLSGAPKEAPKTFSTYSIEKFALSVLNPEKLINYIEYTPNFCCFYYKDNETLKIEIDLQFFEMLMKVSSGYVPSTNEMKGFYQNLLMFKNKLVGIGTKEILITEDDYNIYKIIVENNDVLKMEKLNEG